MVSIPVRINGKVANLIDSSFYRISKVINSIDNCLWNANDKLWEIPYNENNLEKIKVFLSNDDYKKIKEKRYSLDSEIKRLFPFLHNYQVDGIIHIINGKRLLSDEVGLGKTLQSICFSEYIKAKKSLVVTISALKKQWQREIKKFFPDSKTTIIPNDNKNKRKKVLDKYDDGYLIINYEQLRLNDVIDFLQNINFDVIIFDEIHKIKNNKTALFKGASKLKTNIKLGLTATPFINKPTELFNIVDFLKPNFLPWYEFAREYCEWDEVYAGYNKGFIKTIVGFKNLDKLHNHLLPLMIRRKKVDVLSELPPKTYKILSCQPSSRQRKVIDKFFSEAKNLYDDFGLDNSVLASLTFARMACDSLELLQESSSLKTIDVEGNDSAKIEALKDFLPSVNGKVLLFTQWKRMAFILHREFPDSLVITGETKDKQSVIDEFKNSDKKFLISTDCLQYGVNLQFISTLIHVDLPWSPADIEQREGRVDRLGQKNNILVVKVVIEDSIEDYVLGILNKKSKMFYNVIDGSINEKTDLDIVKYIFENNNLNK